MDSKEKQRRPHWYERRAHADGWEVESLNLNGEWEVIDSPCFGARKYRVVPDAEGSAALVWRSISQAIQLTILSM